MIQNTTLPHGGQESSHAAAAGDAPAGAPAAGPTTTSDDFARVRQALDVRRYYQSRMAGVQLVESGDGYKHVPCPFHADGDKPNLHIRKDGRFKCFSCGASGDPFDYEVKTSNVSKGEALKRLAAEAGVTLAPRRQGGRPPEKPATLDTVEARHKALLACAPALDFLARARAIPRPVVERFKLGLVSIREEGNLAQFDFSYPIYVLDPKGNADLHPCVRRYIPHNPKDKFRRFWSPAFAAAQAALKLDKRPRAPLFGVVEAMEWRRTHETDREAIDLDLLLLEGEDKALAAHGLDLPGVGLTLGVGTWPAHWERFCRGMRVVYCPDMDAAGLAGVEKCAAFVRKAGAASLRVVRLPLDGTPEDKDLQDWILKRGGTREAFVELIKTAEVIDLSARGVVEAGPGAAEAPTVDDADLGASTPSGPRKSRIDTTDRDLPGMTTALQDLILARCIGVTTAKTEEGQSPPRDIELWQRSGLLVRVVRDAAPTRGVVRPPGAPTIAPLPRGHLRELAGRVASWIETRETKQGEKIIPVYPPDPVLAALEDRGSWPFPYLDGVIETPTLRPDGSIIDRPGYDAATGLLYDAGGVVYPAVPDRPTEDDVRSAIALTMEPFADFKFVSETDRSATLSALLTVPARLLVEGPLPMYAIRAPVRGSGKTLIADVIATIWTGRRAARMTHVEDEAEERKRLHAICISGDPIVLMDNVEKPLQSGVLAAALTSREIRERLLGVTRMVTAPMDGLWFCTGNNLAVRGDLSRRVVPIDIDPGTEFPEERADFKHANLLAWVRENRPRLVSAALTILRAYFVAGKPQASKLVPFGSFEAWSALVRSCVVGLGLPDPIGARDRIRKDADLEAEALKVALMSWKEALGVGKPWTLSEVIAWIEAREGRKAKGKKKDAELFEESEEDKAEKQLARDLREALGNLDEKYDGWRLNSRRLGKALHHHGGRIVDGLAFMAGDKTWKGVKWRVVEGRNLTVLTVPPAAPSPGKSSVPNPSGEDSKGRVEIPGPGYDLKQSQDSQDSQGGETENEEEI